jgi:putative methyltransferase
MIMFRRFTHSRKIKLDPNAPEYQKVGALLIDPSCSGSGIIGRDEMPTLHLPSPNSNPAPSSYKSKARQDRHSSLKRNHTSSSEPLDLVDDNGTITPINSPSDLQTRLAALSAFQFSLLLHAMAFPSAHKITYSTCSIHAAENEAVVTSALASSIAKERGWRILKRDEQVRGMREWPIRGDAEACGGDDAGQAGEEVADACIRANKGDEYGTMGFFLAAFVRHRDVPVDDRAARVMRDEKGFIVRDLMGIPVTAFPEEQDEEEWNGFEEEEEDYSENGVEMREERVEGKVNSTESDGIVDIVAGSQADIVGNRGKKRKRKMKKGKKSSSILGRS